MHNRSIICVSSFVPHFVLGARNLDPVIVYRAQMLSLHSFYSCVFAAGTEGPRSPPQRTGRYHQVAPTQECCDEHDRQRRGFHRCAFYPYWLRRRNPPHGRVSNSALLECGDLSPLSLPARNVQSPGPASALLSCLSGAWKPALTHSLSLS